MWAEGVLRTHHYDTARMDYRVPRTNDNQLVCDRLGLAGACGKPANAGDYLSQTHPCGTARMDYHVPRTNDSQLVCFRAGSHTSETPACAITQIRAFLLHRMCSMCWLSTRGTRQTVGDGSSLWTLGTV